MSIEPRERLIVALDVPSADEARRLLDRVGDAVGFVKIGLDCSRPPAQTSCAGPWRRTSGCFSI